MSNHYHLVIDTPNCDIDKFMYEFNKSFSLKLRKETNMINRMFGGRYKWSIIKDRSHYFHVMKYVFRNPVKAKITSTVEQYNYSTINIILNKKQFPTKIKPYINILKYLNWFNETHTQEQNNSITSGLNKTIFTYSGSREKRKPPTFKAMD